MTFLAFKEIARRDHDWSYDERSESYDHKQRQKELRKAGDGRPWEENPKEQARRIWCWWKKNRDAVPAQWQVVRIIALLQISSAACERLFSALKAIIAAVGESASAVTLNARLIERSNYLQQVVF
jgi:hypothetical protein